MKNLLFIYIGFIKKSRKQSWYQNADGFFDGNNNKMSFYFFASHIPLKRIFNPGNHMIVLEARLEKEIIPLEEEGWASLLLVKSLLLLFFDYSLRALHLPLGMGSLKMKELHSPSYPL